MTHTARTPALAGEPGPPQRRATSGRSWLSAGGAWVALIPALVTMGTVLYQFSRPSLWRDEGATLSAVSRTLPQMLRMLGNVDVVHGLYYLTMWFWVRVAGYGVVALRFPSAVAMAVTAGMLALLGRRLVSGRAGLASGLVLAALPVVSHYAQDARPYAMEAALATIASYLLLRAVEPGRRRRRWLVAYGVAMALLGLGNLFGLLLVPVHAIALAAWVRGGGDAAGGDGPRAVAPSQPGAPGAGPAQAQQVRALARGWLVAVVAAGLVAIPVAVIAWRQRAQVSWIKPPTVKTLISLGGLIGENALAATVVVVVAAAVAYAVLRGPAARRASWPTGLVALAAAWLVLPSALLLGLSLVHPYFSLRYVIFCVPAAALLAGTAIAALGRFAGLIALVIIVAVALPEQAHVRRPAGHGENLRRLGAILAARARPGDAILFEGRNIREFEAAYPADYRSVRDIGLGRSAVQASLLIGTNAPSAVVRSRLAAAARLWVMETGAQRGHVPVLDGQPFVKMRRWDVTGIWLVLYVRQSGAGG